MYEVKVISSFYEATNGKKNRVGDVLTVSKERLDVLSGNNEYGRTFVEVLREIKEAAPVVHNEKPQSISNKKSYNGNKKRK